MSRPLRIEFAGALYHVMARGDARAAIYRDDADRQAFCGGLWRACERFDWRVWSWCLMGNHYHLLVETLRPTLSRGLREVNGVQYSRVAAGRDDAIRAAYASGAYTLKAIGDHFGLHYATISRIARREMLQNKT